MILRITYFVYLYAFGVVTVPILPTEQWYTLQNPGSHAMALSGEATDPRCLLPRDEDRIFFSFTGYEV